MSGTQAINSVDGSVLITCGYNDQVIDGVAIGLAWVILHDNHILGWSLTDPTVTPIIIGSMDVPVTADTSPVVSPQWAQYFGGTVFVPDTWRGALAEFFTHIATNNGAQRKVYAKFYTPELASAWRQWASDNPLALSAPPNL
jgi:hypothetical protein